MFEEFDAVLSDGGRGVCDVDDESVGLASHELCGDDDALDPVFGVVHDDFAEVVVLFDANGAFDGFEPEVLDLEGVLSGGDLQFEAAVGIGCHPDDLLVTLEEDDGSVFDGLSLFVDDAPDRGAESCSGGVGEACEEEYGREDPHFCKGCALIRHGRMFILRRKDM